MQTPYGYVSIISDVPVKPSHAIRRSLEPHNTTLSEETAVYQDSVLVLHTYSRVTKIKQIGEEGKDQESIQSSNIPDPGYRLRK